MCKMSCFFLLDYYDAFAIWSNISNCSCSAHRFLGSLIPPILNHHFPFIISPLFKKYVIPQENRLIDNQLIGTNFLHFDTQLEIIVFYYRLLINLVQYFQNLKNVGIVYTCFLNDLTFVIFLYLFLQCIFFTDFPSTQPLFMTSSLLSIPSLMPTLGMSYEIFIFMKASLTDMFLLIKAEVLPCFII